MLFVNIQKPDQFFRMIGKCQGSVSYLDGQGRRQDLKSLAAHLLSSGAALRPQTIASLDVVAGLPEDRQRMIRYMMDEKAC